MSDTNVLWTVHIQLLVIKGSAQIGGDVTVCLTFKSTWGHKDVAVSSQQTSGHSNMAVIYTGFVDGYGSR